MTGDRIRGVRARAALARVFIAICIIGFTLVDSASPYSQMLDLRITRHSAKVVSEAVFFCARFLFWIAPPRVRVTLSSVLAWGWNSLFLRRQDCFVLSLISKIK